VHMSPGGDTRFPPIDPALWREAARTSHPAGPGDDAGYDFVSYLKANAVSSQR
jgi:dihydrofolate reductase